MSGISKGITRGWMQLGTRFLPFADVASPTLPLSRILRLSLFQVTVGMASVLLVGTLNRVMILELSVPSWLVALMVSLPLVFAPFRALIGFRSDTHRSTLGWRRTPYIWFGSLVQFGGLAIMPFALIVLSGDSHGPPMIGQLGAGLAFLLVGAGMHTTQTAGLALATDIAAPDVRPRVVALMYIMLLAAMIVSAGVFGVLLADFSEIRLIQVIQGAGLLTIVVNGLALWKQEVRDPSRVEVDQPPADFYRSWQAFVEGGRSTRLLASVGLGAAAFGMQDVLLEPYGGQVLHLSVGSTTSLTALLALGSLSGFGLAAFLLGRGANSCRIAGMGALVGILAFAAVIFAAPMEAPALFAIGTALIGFGNGLFSVGTLTAAMGLAQNGESGIALGAWGAVQASASGIAIAAGGAIRDVFSGLAVNGALGTALAGAATGYEVVYYLEILFLFATMAAIGPLAGLSGDLNRSPSEKFGLAEMPG
jgi:BCD family chlorophyll transporter-like MFS transporter